MMVSIFYFPLKGIRTPWKQLIPGVRRELHKSVLECLLVAEGAELLNATRSCDKDVRDTGANLKRLPLTGSGTSKCW